MNKLLSSIFFCLLLASPVFLSSCSEENDEEDEYANWKERNDGQTDQWAQGASSGTYRKILTYAKSESASSLANSDYIYVEEVEKGSGTESPIYTDNVRVAYRGRYIPTKSYPEGYVFDQTFLGNFDWKTANMIDASPEGLVEGNIVAGTIHDIKRTLFCQIGIAGIRIAHEIPSGCFCLGDVVQSDCTVMVVQQTSKRENNAIAVGVEIPLSRSEAKGPRLVVDPFQRLRLVVIIEVIAVRQHIGNQRGSNAIDRCRNQLPTAQTVVATNALLHRSIHAARSNELGAIGNNKTRINGVGERPCNRQHLT